MAKKRERTQVKNKILGDILADEPKIEMLSNREIIVDGCRGVVEYGENDIRLSLGDTVMKISGDKLVITSFDGSIAIINGKISDISFAS